MSSLLETLQRLLEIPTADLKVALSLASDAVASALRADKVDAFLYEPEKDSLVALGTSNQPLSAKERRHGLDVLPISNGGRVVQVYQTGATFRTGELDKDPEELRGVKETFEIKSKIGVPLEIGGARRGMMMIASLHPEFFTEQDVSFAEAVARWVGMVAHRAELSEEIARNAAEQGRRAVAEELITVLAHDLRNYLSPIDIRLRMIRRRAESEARDVDVRDADAALKGVGRLTALISELLDVARIDQGVFQIEVRPVDLVGLVEDAVKGLSTPEHPIILKAAEELIVAADPARIRQCIENLLSNAVKHSPHGAEVAIFMRRVRNHHGDMARLSIVDEGPGVPPEVLPHIFERFVSAETKQGGLGLGLYLAKRIATMHDGDLQVESSPGKGARFTLSLHVFDCTA
jgi:two-component system, OmpR family, sensor kinase